MKRDAFYIKIIWILILLIAWEAVTRLDLVNTYILPPFSEVIKVMIEELDKGVLGLQVLNSLKIVLVGFVVSIFVSGILAVLCMCTQIIESFVRTLCTILNPLPGVALMPLFMMWFGLGNGVLLALILHGVAWPLTTNLLTGLHSIPGTYTDWADNIECTLWNRVIHIYFFCIMPYLLSGLRIGWGRAWRALIAGEMVFGMIGTLGGLGYYIYKARSYGSMDKVFVGIIIIIVIGVFVEEFLFRLVEKYTIEKWGMSDGK
jgi:NitT/TauT family transport system permease protein